MEALNDLKVLLTRDSNVTDVTSGILNIDIVRGNEYYESVIELTDTGQLIITSKNKNLDPSINPDVRFNSQIDVLIDEQPFRQTYLFKGFITDINVEYGAFNEDTIITITATDQIGLLQRHQFTEEFSDYVRANYPDGITIIDLCDLITSGIEIENVIFWTDWQFLRGVSADPITCPLAKVAIKPGDYAWDTIIKLAQSSLFTIEQRPEGFALFPYVKYDPYMYDFIYDLPIIFNAPVMFSSDGTAIPYKSVILDDGFKRTTNQVEINNSSVEFGTGDTFVENSSNYGPYTSNQSSGEWGSARLSFNTLFSGTEDTATTYLDLASDIIESDSLPKLDIASITVDADKYWNTVIGGADLATINNYLGSNEYSTYRIRHYVNPSLTISKFYKIIGIRYNISYNNFYATYSFKESDYYKLQQLNMPVIQMNSLTGDTNFNFTATLTNYDPTEIDSVYWCLNGDDDIADLVVATYNGSRFKNNTPRTGYTQTWNFDDDGILKSPHYGNGYWNVYAYVKFKNGWTIVPKVQLEVGSPIPIADFTWSQNLTNNYGQVTFTDESRNNETGEVDSYLWNFGDGTTSTQRNPVHVYSPAPGQYSYNVSLTVYALFGGGTNTKTTTITLSEPVMTANFTSSISNQIVTFTNTSTNVGFEEPDAYLWEFGDGTISTEKNPTHVFPSNASETKTYNVKLTVKNIWETSATVTKPVTIASLYKTGSLPVDTIRFRADSYTPTSITNSTPYMIYLQARRSPDLTNLIYLKPTYWTGSNIVWYEADGTTAESTDPYNLTRNPTISAPSQYGLSPKPTTANVSTNWNLSTLLGSTTNFINDLTMIFRDVSGSTAPDRYTKINVDVPDSFGGWLNIGYFDIPGGRMIPTAPLGLVTEKTFTMTALRPMPPNIPYFKYTFNNTTASFTSMETADSYAWNFGDGTTSTLKDPVHTFPSRGTYNVTLAVTNGGVVTRTTTEPVIVEAMAPFNVRYVKFVQNLHTGTHAFDTPYLSEFTTNFSLSDNYTYSSSPTGPITVAKAETYSMEYRQGIPTSGLINPLTSPKNKDFVGSGYRIKSLDGTYRTEWNLIVDYIQPVKNIKDFSIKAGRYTESGFPETLATGISYSIYVTDYVGNSSGLGTATWTKIGDITPTSIPLNSFATYNITPS